MLHDEDVLPEKHLDEDQFHCLMESEFSEKYIIRMNCQTHIL